MTDVQSALSSLRRPRTLVTAARKGIALYQRARDLRAALGRTPSSDSACDVLLTAEADMEERRLRGDATYSVTRHICMLTALMAEAGATRAAV